MIERRVPMTHTAQDAREDVRLTMTKQYWAEHRGRIAGPFQTREDALAAFRATYPFNGPDYEARAPRNQITTGYGNGGAWFDIRWHNAKED